MNVPQTNAMGSLQGSIMDTKEYMVVIKSVVAKQHAGHAVCGVLHANSRNVFSLD